jgi:hypothetical protein
MTGIEQTEPAVSNPPTGSPRILAHLIYDDVGGAIEWLTAAFGFQERRAARHASPDGSVGGPRWRSPTASSPWGSRPSTATALAGA